MSCPSNNFIKSLDLLQDGIGGRGPGEGLRLGVVFRDKQLYSFDELRHAFEAAAADGFLSDDVEPDFYLVKPRAVRGRVVHVIAGAGGQPPADALMFVGRVIVDNEMHV